MTAPDYRWRDGLTGLFITARRAAQLSRKRVTRVLVGRRKKERP